MAPPQIPGIPIPMLTGPLVLGYMWGYLLWGVLIVQMYIYYISFPKERLLLKCYVWLMFILETVFIIFSTIAAWNAYGPGWGDPDTLLIIDWSWEPLPALNGFIAFMAQSFYNWRIWHLTRNIWIVVLVEIIALMQVTVAFYYDIAVSVRGRGIDKLIELTPWISAWLSGSAACDIIITITVVIALHKANSRTRLKQTINKLTRLIRFTVETGLITSVMAVVELVLWLSSHQWNIHFIGFLVLGKLYSNAMVATLNSRAGMFAGPMELTIDTSALHVSSAFWGDKESRNRVAGRQPHASIQINKSTNSNSPAGRLRSFVFAPFNSNGKVVSGAKVESVGLDVRVDSDVQVDQDVKVPSDANV